jgi:exosortase
VSVLLVLITFLWAYWPTLRLMVDAWAREPDYSHGYLVVPLALYFLWARRDSFPGFQLQFAWPGMALIVASIFIRFVSSYYFLEDLDGWSITIWTAGVVWLVGGRQFFWWTLPAVGFLLFMVPLPYRMERWLSLPLQSISSRISCWGLQLLGQPVIAEGNTILIGDDKLFVEEACSGLRIFVGIVALAYACVVLVKRPMWERAVVLASAVPVAVVANATRIIVTAYLFHILPDERKDELHRLVHDGAGWAMIPFAAALFGLVLWYISKLFQEVEVVDVGRLARKKASS